MNSVKPPTVRFSGYGYDKAGKPELFLPGYQGQDVKVHAEIIESPDNGNGKAISIPMQRDGHYWRLANSSSNASVLKPGAAYRFIAEKNGKKEEVPLDYLETIPVGNDTFNRIAKHDLDNPRNSSVMIDLFPDSVLTKEQLAVLDKRERARLGWTDSEVNLNQEHLPVLPMRNHFNKFNEVTLAPKPKQGQENQGVTLQDRLAVKKEGFKAAEVRTHGYEDGLNQLLPKLADRGFSAVVFKPFMGGDNLSSHRYWTTDPYILNDTFRDKDGFRKSLDLMLKNGMKVYADGAFVNQGMNGIQIMSNLKHGTSSPYWGNWFHFPNHKSGGRTSYPSLAQEKYEFGILPTKEDKNGNPVLDTNAFKVRFINDPDGKDAFGNAYNKNKPTFIELYDPRLEQADGTPIPIGEKVSDPDLLNSKRSVQKYRFPVDPAKLSEKKKSSEPGYAKYLDWDSFRLTVPGADNASKKWDGQIDVALMNTERKEVVDYLDGAVNYWSRMVMNHYTATVAKNMHLAKAQLQKAGMEKPSPIDILNAVTEGEPGGNPNLKILPQKTKLDTDNINPEQAEKYVLAKEDFDKKENGKAFAKTLLKDVPINTVQLPILFKANLNDPKFLENLPLRTGKMANFLEDRLLGLIDVPVAGKPFEWMSNVVFSPRLEKAMGRKMQQIFDDLDSSGNAAKKLQHKEIQSIVADQLGEPLYISLLTGKSLEDAKKLAKNPDELEQAIYDGLPSSLINANPKEASKALPALFRKRLREMDKASPNQSASLKVQVRDEIKRITDDLEPDLVSLANNVLKEREFGLNWRIDAAKDVADIGKVRNEGDPQKRLEVFKEQVQYLNKFWGDKLHQSMRDVFPKSSIIAELTDFGELAGKGNEDKGQQFKKDLFVNNTFTSTPNMDYTYSSLMQLVHYAQRPDEFGASQMSPGEFLNKGLKEMTQGAPLFTQRQLQNLTGSHDFSTTSHAMLMNPVLFNLDRERNLGLVEYFNVASKELESMACFAPERKELEKLGLTGNDVKTAMTSLRTWLSSGTVRGILPDQLKKIEAKSGDQFDYGTLKDYYDAKTKAGHENAKSPDKQIIFNSVTPADVKARFVNALFDQTILPSKLQTGKDLVGDKLGSTDPGKALEPLANSLNGVRDRQAVLNKLAETLTARMSESSEAKAMRGAINNAVLKAAEGNETLQRKDDVQKVIWESLDKTIGKWGSHFGYQSLDVALNHVFEEATSKLKDNKLMQGKSLNQAQIEQIKIDIYNAAMKPVMYKQERVFAIQNALPGNPSVYLPDLFVQGGSEYIKNIYVQNRPIIRTDRLKGQNDDFNRYMDNVGKIFNSRKQLPVLNDGIVLPVATEAADRNGVLPIVRDNGTDQAIVLVDMDKKRVDELAKANLKKIEPWEDQKKSSVPDQPRQQPDNEYTTVPSYRGEKRHIDEQGLNLGLNHLQAGTVYYDHDNPKERFEISNNGELIQITDQNGKQTRNKSFEIKANRILVRDNKSQ